MNVLIWEIKRGMGFAVRYEEREASFCLYPPGRKELYNVGVFYCIHFTLASSFSLLSSTERELMKEGIS